MVLLKNKVLTVISISVFILLNLLHSFDYYGLIYWLPVYLTGGFFGIHLHEFGYFENNMRGKLTLLTSLILVCALLVLTCQYQNCFYMTLYRYASGILIPYIGGSIFHSDTRVPWRFHVTMFIYCTHFILISTVEKIILVLEGVNFYSALFCFIFTPVFVFAILTLVAKIWKEKLPQTWNLITGHRG